MKRNLLFGVVLVIAHASTASAETTVSHFMANDASAGFQWGDSSGRILTAGAYEVGSANNRTVNANYITAQCWDNADHTSWGCNWQDGNGWIPANQFAATRATAHLRFDTSAMNNEAYTFSCTIDPTTWWAFPVCTYTTLQPAVGSVDLVFRRNSEFSATTNGTSQTEYAGYRILTNGSTTSVAADVQGTILGTAVHANGGLATNRGTTITIIRR